MKTQSKRSSAHDNYSIVGILIGIIIVVYFRRQNVVAWYDQKK